MPQTNAVVILPAGGGQPHATLSRDTSLHCTQQLGGSGAPSAPGPYCWEARARMAVRLLNPMDVPVSQALCHPHLGRAPGWFPWCSDHSAPGHPKTWLLATTLCLARPPRSRLLHHSESSPPASSRSPEPHPHTLGSPLRPPLRHSFLLRSIVLVTRHPGDGTLHLEVGVMGSASRWRRRGLPRGFWGVYPTCRCSEAQLPP